VDTPVVPGVTVPATIDCPAASVAVKWTGVFFAKITEMGRAYGDAAPVAVGAVIWAGLFAVMPNVIGAVISVLATTVTEVACVARAAAATVIVCPVPVPDIGEMPAIVTFVSLSRVRVPV
jgi:hypothetical protein